VRGGFNHANDLPVARGSIGQKLVRHAGRIKLFRAVRLKAIPGKDDAVPGYAERGGLAWPVIRLDCAKHT
jgi:hypothetical protein